MNLKETMEKERKSIIKLMELVEKSPEVARQVAMNNLFTRAMEGLKERFALNKTAPSVEVSFDESDSFIKSIHSEKLMDIDYLKTLCSKEGIEVSTKMQECFVYATITFKIVFKDIVLKSEVNPVVQYVKNAGGSNRGHSQSGYSNVI